MFDSMGHDVESTIKLWQLELESDPRIYPEIIDLENVHDKLTVFQIFDGSVKDRFYIQFANR